MNPVDLEEHQERLERFIKDYSERGYRFAWRLSGNEEDAKELVQEAFLRAIKAWGQYDPAKPLEAWFLTILRHVYVDGIKRYERRNSVSLDASLSGEAEGMTFADALPDVREEAMLSRLERREASEEVQAVLDALTPEHRAILTLCDMQGLSYEEICKVLDAPLGTVRSRINRARAAFKKKMLEDCREVEIR